jgi:hypothetical protein
MVEFDGKLQFDAYKDVCPICAEIVETEVWPKIMQCGEHLASPEVSRGELPPPCPVCNHNELVMEWITMSTKDNKGFVHNMYLHCPSCGAGMKREGTDAVTNKPKIRVKMPPKGSIDDPREELAVRAFFRVRNLPCLDEGWDAMGPGVRPYERSEVMQRFYEWTNDEAVAQATLADNPLLKKNQKKKKKRKWF